jgi:hypothetical protein
MLLQQQCYFNTDCIAHKTFAAVICILMHVQFGSVYLVSNAVKYYVRY